MKSSSVNAVIFSKDKQKVLIIKRRDVPVWVLPGGAVEKGETPEEAICREVFEETGCRFSICRKSGIYTPLNRLAVTTHVFVGQIKDGTPMTGPETLNIGFFSQDCLPDSFFHLHFEFLQDAISHPDVVVKKYLKQVTYTGLIKYFFRHPLRVIRFALSRLGFPINS